MYLCTASLSLWGWLSYSPSSAAQASGSALAEKRKRQKPMELHERWLPNSNVYLLRQNCSPKYYATLSVSVAVCIITPMQISITARYYDISTYTLSLAIIRCMYSQPYNTVCCGKSWHPAARGYCYGMTLMSSCNELQSWLNGINHRLVLPSWRSCHCQPT